MLDIFDEWNELDSWWKTHCRLMRMDAKLLVDWFSSPGFNWLTNS